MHEVLRARGIKVFEERTAPPVNEDELHADMRLALKLERRYGASAKRDKQIEHDVSLWHRVRTLRPNAVESPLAARYWIVTLDSHFLAFDRFKREIVREPIPLCIRPGTLIQMLQFWVPRSAEFERAMLSSMRLPVIVGDFDRDAEKVTIRILQVLSRFENVGDLPSETIAAILVNDALREKMRLPMERAKEVDLIKEALIAEHQAAKEALAATSEKAARLQGEVGQGARTIEGLQTQVATQRQVLDEELERRRGVEKKVQDWQEAEVTRQNREANRKTARRFLAFKVALPLLAILVSAFFAARTSAQISGWRFGWAFLGFLSTLLLPWGWLSDYHGAKQDAVKDTRAFALFHRTRAWLFWLLGILACGVGANAAWFFFGHGRGWF
jgi:uncharacterized coiled-coil protein SlyX